MRYDKKAAFKRLKIPKKLQKRVFIIKIPNWICWLARKTGLVSKCSIGYCGSWLNIVVVITGDKMAENDYTLAHEILGHRKKHKKLKLTHEEARAVEKGLLAIKSIHPAFYKERVKRIRKYQKEGPISLVQRILGSTYYKNVNLKKLK